MGMSSAPASAAAKTPATTSAATDVADNLGNIGSPDPILSREAKINLFKGGAPAVKEVMENLANSNPVVKQNARKALSIIREAAMPQLVQALSDGRSSVSAIAGEVLLQPEQNVAKVEKIETKVTKIETDVMRANATAERAEKSASEVSKDLKIAMENAQEKWENAGKRFTAMETRLSAMEAKINESKEALTVAQREEEEMTRRMSNAEASLTELNDKLQIALNNGVSNKVFRAVKPKVFAQKKRVKSLEAKLQTKTSERIALELKICNWERQMAEYEKKTAEAKAATEAAEKTANEAKEAASAEEVIYFIPSCSDWRGRKCR